MKRVFSLVLSFVLLFTLLPTAAFADELSSAVSYEENMVTVTVTMDTQVVAQDVSNYALTALPATAEVSVSAGSTVKDVLTKWSTDQSVAVTITDSSYGPYLTTIGDFGAFGTTAFETMCTNAGYTPTGSNDIFQFAGWTYSVGNTSGQGIGNDTVSGGETIAFRYGLYMTSGTYEQVDHAFLDAYNKLAALIDRGDAADENDFTEAQWQTLTTALAAAKSEKSAIDTAAGGLWLSYFAEKQTALWGTNSPTDKLQKAALALSNALSKVVTPTGITFTSNDVEIPLNKTFTIPYTVGPEGAAQDVTYEIFLGDGKFTVSNTGVITPSAMNNLCWVKVACKDVPGVFSYFKFKIVAADSSAEASTLLTNIAASYVEESSEWVMLDMAAYEDVVPTAVSKSSENAKNTYINSAITTLSGESVSEANYAKAILVLQALGADPQTIYPQGSSTAISAINGLVNLSSHSASAWVAPYTLAALNQGNYGTDTLEQEIIAAVLANQGEDGSWNEWGDKIQTTANVIAGLSFYYGTVEAVTTALDKAITFLSNQQKANGTFDAYGRGADANTQAMVVIALAAMGINPDTDTRFVKGGVSVLDALVSFGLADNSALGYMNNTTASSGATEQGFRALVAAKAMMDSGNAFNVYDFSANEVTPAYYYTAPTPGGGSSRPSRPDSTITVSFELKTHEETWIAAHNVSVSEDASVGDLFTKVLDARGNFSYVNDNGYISSITKGETTLAAFSYGQNSGWKYQVNGVAPAVGMNDKALASGDEVVWYYVVDYTLDTDRDEGNISGSSVSGGESGESEAPAESASTYSDVVDHWAAEAIRACTEAGLMQGTGDGKFSPDMTASRAMVAKMLHTMEKATGTAAKNIFSDVPDGAWYTDAALWASENGIVTGYDGDFMPSEAITREQLAVMLWRYSARKNDVSAKDDKLLSYSDASEASDWAKDALSWACEIGLLQGSDGKMMPKKTVTRAELAVVFSNYLNIFA